MKEECSNCKYFLYIEDYKGICRRYPKEIKKHNSTGAENGKVKAITK